MHRAFSSWYRALPITPCTCSAEGVVTSWNAGAERMKGYAPDEIIGRHFSQFFTGEDRDAGLPQKALATARQVGRFVRRLAGPQGRHPYPGSPRFLMPSMTRPGHLSAAKITRDLTERHAAQRALADSERHFRMLVQGVTDYAIYLLDPSGIVTNWNAGAERIEEYVAEEIVGRRFSVFYPPEQRAAGAPAKALAIATREGRFEAEDWRIHKDGTRFFASVVIDATAETTEKLPDLQKSPATSPSDARQKKRCATASGSSVCWSG